MRLIRVEPAGSVTIVECGPTESELLFVRKQIGCQTAVPVRVHRHDPVIDMWVDEDGLMMTNPRPNYLATWIVQRCAGVHGFLDEVAHSVYFGTVVFSASDKFGGIMGLSAKSEDGLIRLIRELGGWVHDDTVESDVTT